MRLQLLFLSVVLFGLVACAREHRSQLPELAGVVNDQGRQACGEIFPQGKWQFVHSIDFVMQGGSGSTVLGVTSITGGDIACALVTVEGLTLFEAVFGHDGQIEVRRAVPPFDGPEFAGGLLRDIRAIFQPPSGNMIITGQLADGIPVCRYTGGDTEVVDVLPDVNGCWQIRSYNQEQLLNRSIVGQACRQQGENPIPEYLEMKIYGPTGYTLKMTLIRADALQ